MTCIASTGGWYPWVICHAVALVDDVPVFRTLNDSYGQVLRRLIKKVGRDDGQRPILARRQTIAQEAGKSVETVYRALREFESRGWIEQREKKAGVGLMGSNSEIVFTKDLCDLLELPYAGRERVNRNKPSVADNRSYKAIVVSNIQPSLKEQPGEFAQMRTQKLSTNGNEENPKTVRIGKWSVPAELAWLVNDKGLSPTGLLALMKAARNHGKLLSDVVACVKQYLGKLEGRALFAYLNSLVMLERDFAFEVEQKVEKVVKKQVKQKVCQQLETEKVRLQGKWFMSKLSGAVFEVEKSGWVRMVSLDVDGRAREGCKLLEMAFVNAEREGLLVECAVGMMPVRIPG